MSVPLALFLVATCVCLGTAFLIVVRAFRTSVWWGLIVMFVPLGRIAFVLTHWSETAKPFLINLLSLAAAIGLLLGTSLGEEFKASRAGKPSEAAATMAPTPAPREVRDLAANDPPTPPPAAATAPPADPLAARRAAYTRHATELAAAYQQLEAERGKLKPGSPAVATFNARAARYQRDLQAAADEKAKLDALDHAANLDAESAAALASLQASAGAGDYEAFAATLGRALDAYRQTPSFPALVAFARTSLAGVTVDRVAAALSARSAGSARGDFERTTRQVQAIVNQTPPVVARPPARAEVYHYAFHPGTNPPDYRAVDLAATRELWKGQYVYMDDAPGVYYRSADCEFNPQTKCFYLSRSVPKKRLSDAEYQELTRLYRLLGQQEKAASDAAPSAGRAERISADLAALKARLDGYAAR